MRSWVYRCTPCHGCIQAQFFDSYANRVSSTVGKVSSAGVTELDPFNADGSYLIRNVEGRTRISGERVPFGGPYLSATTIQMLKDWIDQGMPETPDGPPATGGGTRPPPDGTNDDDGDDDDDDED